MRTRLLSIFLMLFFFTFCSPNTFAQDYTQLNLPEGAKALLSKGTINEIAYSLDGTRLAVATREMPTATEVKQWLSAAQRLNLTDAGFKEVFSSYNNSSQR